MGFKVENNVKKLTNHLEMTVEQMILKVYHDEQLKQLIWDKLSQNEQTVLFNRVISDEKKTFSELAEMLNKSRNSIIEYEAKAIYVIKNNLKEMSLI